MFKSGLSAKILGVSQIESDKRQNSSRNQISPAFTSKLQNALLSMENSKLISKRVRFEISNYSESNQFRFHYRSIRYSSQFVYGKSACRRAGALPQTLMKCMGVIGTSLPANGSAWVSLDAAHVEPAYVALPVPLPAAPFSRAQ